MYSNHMVIEKMRLVEHESVHWLNMNTNIENTMKQCERCLDYQHTQPQEKIPHSLPAKPWEIVDVKIIL